MAPRKQPWFRFYVEAVGDLKLARLTPAQKWLWVVVLAAAKQSAVEGWLLLSERVAMTTADLARMADMRERDVAAAVEAMEALGLIEFDSDIGAWRVVAWSRRQYESDNVTDRTRKHRSRNDDGTFHQRPKERSGNGDGTHQITETDTEPETTPPTPPRTLTAVAADKPPPSASDSAFDDVWGRYPRKTKRLEALKAWRARVRAGVSPDELARAVENYAARCRREGTEERFVMHGSSFFGPNERWRDFLDDDRFDATVNPHLHTRYVSPV